MTASYNVMGDLGDFNMGEVEEEISCCCCCDTTFMVTDLGLIQEEEEVAEAAVGVEGVFSVVGKGGIVPRTGGGEIILVGDVGSSMELGSWLINGAGGSCPLAFEGDVPNRTDGDDTFCGVHNPLLPLLLLLLLLRAMEDARGLLLWGVDGETSNLARSFLNERCEDWVGLGVSGERGGDVGRVLSTLSTLSTFSSGCPTSSTSWDTTFASVPTATGILAAVCSDKEGSLTSSFGGTGLG